MGIVREGEGGTNEESSIEIYTLLCVKFAVQQGAQKWCSVTT